MIQSDWLPDGWREVAPYLQDKSPTFVYVPGHAGVKYNEKADKLEATDQLLFFSQDVAPLCHQTAR